MAHKRFGKDSFASVHLPAARSYVRAPGRGRLYVFGAVGVVAVGAFFAVDAFLGGASAVAGGRLSDSHALFGTECSTCHTPFQGVADRKCGACHEARGDRLAHYSWERHYLYRSNDFDRSAATTLETPCAACHAEHEGRNASLQTVSDRRCQTCHEFESFADGHPEFAFAVDGLPDGTNLSFPHVLHVREVMSEEDLEVAEAACLTCHEPDTSGRSFRPIGFERSCDACHLGSKPSPRLPVDDGEEPGVLTLEQIRASDEPGSRWAHYWDPTEFTVLGNTVQKRPVYHEDPWIMENLRRLRRELYPGASLADLLRASADLPSSTSSPRLLYEEALEELRRRIESLSGEPSRDVQAELDLLRRLLGLVEERLEDPYASLDETRFSVSVIDQAAGVASGEVDVEAYQDVIESLTEECRSCHVLERATIARVQKDQRTLVRAEFDHRAHVIHASCLDCHDRIPVGTYVANEDSVPARVDRAEIQNLPRIASCRSCHGPSGPEERCTTCHLFHPEPPGGSTLTRSVR